MVNKNTNKNTFVLGVIQDDEGEHTIYAAVSVIDATTNKVTDTFCGGPIRDMVHEHIIPFIGNTSTNKVEEYATQKELTDAFTDFLTNAGFEGISINPTFIYVMTPSWSEMRGSGELAEKLTKIKYDPDEFEEKMHIKALSTDKFLSLFNISEEEVYSANADFPIDFKECTLLGGVGLITLLIPILNKKRV